MNPSFIRSVSQRNAVRNEYIRNLQLETANNLQNYNANQIFKQTGQVPPSITALVDTRSVTEKYSDIQKAKVALISGLREITDGANANVIADSIHGNEIVELLNNLPQIVSDIKPKWVLGITAPAFLAYWNRYKQALASNSGVTNFGMLESNQLLTNIQGVLQNIQATLPTAEDYQKLKQIVSMLPETENQSLAIKTIDDSMKEAEQISAQARKVAQIENGENADPILIEQRVKSLNEILSEIPSKRDINDLTSQAQVAVSLGRNSQEANQITQSVLSLIQPQDEIVATEEAMRPSIKSTSATETSELTEKTKDIYSQSPLQSGTFQIPETMEEFEELPTWYFKKRFINTLYRGDAQFRDAVQWNGVKKDIQNLAVGEKSESYWRKTNIPELLEEYFRGQSGSKAPISNPTTVEGKGMRPKRVMGKGINSHRTHAPSTSLTSGGNYRRIPKLDASKKVEKIPSYIQFGSHLLHQHNLQGGILQIRRKSGNIINELPRQSIGGKLKKVLITLTGTGSPSFEDINELSEHDKNLLNKVVKHCKIDQRLLVPTPNKTKEEQDMNRLQILTGEIHAGQNNPAVVRELKTLLLRLKNSGRIPKREAHEILEDLLSLGY
jgi:hypothetical protein